MDAAFEFGAELGWPRFIILVVLAAFVAAASTGLLIRGDFLRLWRKIGNGYLWLRYHGQRRRRCRVVDGASREFCEKDPLGGAFEFEALLLRYDSRLAEGEAVAERIDSGLRVTVAGPQIADFYAALRALFDEHAWLAFHPAVINDQSTHAKTLKWLRFETVVAKAETLKALIPLLHRDKATLRQDEAFCRACESWNQMRSVLQSRGRSLNEYDPRIRSILIKLNTSWSACDAMGRRSQTLLESAEGSSLAKLEKLLDLLDRLASKERGADVGLFEPEINICIVLVGRRETVEKGTAPYIAYIENAMRHDVDIFYLLARGLRNVGVASMICESLGRRHLARQTLRLEDEVEANGDTVPSILLCVEVPEATLQASNKSTRDENRPS